MVVRSKYLQKCGYWNTVLNKSTQHTEWRQHWRLVLAVSSPAVVLKDGRLPERMTTIFIHHSRPTLSRHYSPSDCDYNHSFLNFPCHLCSASRKILLFLRNHYFGFSYLPTCFIHSPCHLGLSLCSLPESSFNFNPEDGGDLFWWNVGISTYKTTRCYNP
jgi:hypothetical protein